MFYKILHDALEYIRVIHEKHGYPIEFRKFARALEVKIRLAKKNYCYIDKGQAILALDYENYIRRISYIAMHELAHLILKSGGFEWDLASEYEDSIIAELYLERICNVAASHLITPAYFVEEAIGSWGYSPLAVRHLSLKCSIPLPDAMNRIVHFDENVSVAGFITSGKTVLHQTRQNCRLPFKRFDTLPANHPVFRAKPDVNTKIHVQETDLICTRIPNTQQRLALVIATD